MRFKPIELAAGALLVIALCGAAQPSEPSAQAPAAAAQDAVPQDVVAPADAPSEPASGEVAAPPVAEPTNAPASPATAEEPPVAPTEPPAEPAAPADQADQAATPAPAFAVPAKGEPPTKEFMVGVWAEPGKSCETAIDFKADGTMIGPFPRWELSDAGELTMVGNRQKIMLSVLDKDTMQSRRAPTDPPRTLKRCGA